MRRLMFAALGSAAALAATPASASLVYDASLSVSAQGFGNAPRALTIQGNGNATIEGGCVGVTNSGGINVGGAGSCRGSDAAFQGNTYVTSLHDEANPLDDNQKHGIPTVGQLGWASANDVGILFNVTDPGGDGVTLLDLTLKFYTAAGVFVGSIDNRVGGDFFSATDVGNGAAGFIFVVADDQKAYINGILGMAGSSTFRTALEATVSGVHGGPESFAIINLRNPPAVPEPATWAMMLLGFGGIGMAMRRKQRRSGALMQVA